MQLGSRHDLKRSIEARTPDGSVPTMPAGVIGRQNGYAFQRGRHFLVRRGFDPDVALDAVVCDAQGKDIGDRTQIGWLVAEEV
jgi:hypothetical protein